MPSWLAKINGFELVDEYGNHHIFDKVVERYTQNSLVGFFPDWSDQNITSSEYSWVNAYPGDLYNGADSENTFFDDGTNRYGASTYLINDYIKVKFLDLFFKFCYIMSYICFILTKSNLVYIPLWQLKLKLFDCNYANVQPH